MEKKKLTGMTVCKIFNMWPEAKILENLEKNVQKYIFQKNLSLIFFLYFQVYL